MNAPNSQTAVLILAAGKVADRLPFLRIRNDSPALLPLNTKPIAAHIATFYKQHGITELYLAIDAPSLKAVSQELGEFSGDISLIPLAKTKNVNDTLSQALDQLPNSKDIIINVATSIPTVLAEPNHALIDLEHTTCDDWSGVSETDGIITFLNKGTKLPGRAFTGIFRCSAQAAKVAAKNCISSEDLLDCLKQLHSSAELSFTTTSWIDCGHELNYHRARIQVTSSRAFNTIKTDSCRGVLQKTSTNVEKLTNECAYFHMLPERIAHYFPRTQPIRINPDASASYRLEYYGYPTIAECQLYWDLSPKLWARLFEHLNIALSDFRQFPYSIGLEAHHALYYKKTLSRLRTFEAQLPTHLAKLLAAPVFINAHYCKPFTMLAETVERHLPKLYREDDFCVMHGDFCFNNILHDPNTGIVRFIDPRGSFSDRCIGIYGDRKYDLAKLNHSARFAYDYIVNGLYKLNIQDDCIDYKINLRENHAQIEHLTTDLIQKQRCDINEIDFLTSLLFISMCELHCDNQQRQLMMYFHGLLLLNETLPKLERQDADLH